jgi:peptide/nickel transport system substrate-binding protein
MRYQLFALPSVILVAALALAACTPPTVVETPFVELKQEAVKTAEVVKEIEPAVVTATPEPEVIAGFNSKDPATFVQLNLGEPETLDPALDYETGGGEILRNVYETLITHEREKPASFVPLLALEVPSTENGGISADGLTYTFKIRTGVKFHNGNDLTPADVAYTFQRGLLQGGTASPQWLLAEPLIGAGVDDISLLVDPEGNLYDDQAGMQAADPAALLAACEKVKAAIVADDAAGTVTFTLAQPWGPFIPTLANFWGSVMDQDWVIETAAVKPGRISTPSPRISIPSLRSPTAPAPSCSNPGPGDWKLCWCAMSATGRPSRCGQAPPPGLPPWSVW